MSFREIVIKEITKLEKNESFVYESVPGTAVHHMKVTDTEIDFQVEGEEQAQLTLELEAENEYEVMIDGFHMGIMKTNLGGKLVISVEFNGKSQSVVVKKM